MYAMTKTARRSVPRPPRQTSSSASRMPNVPTMRLLATYAPTALSTRARAGSVQGSCQIFSGKGRRLVGCRRCSRTSQGVRGTAAGDGCRADETADDNCQIGAGFAERVAAGAMNASDGASGSTASRWRKSFRSVASHQAVRL